MDVAEFMGIERVDERSWQLRVEPHVSTPGDFLFGGCGLGAGVVALEAAAARPVVWATAQYLSYAPLWSTMRIDVTVAVAGRQTTQARATGWVEDREILTVNAALGHTDLDLGGVWVEPPVVPEPDHCPPRRLPECSAARSSSTSRRASPRGGPSSSSTARPGTAARPCGAGSPATSPRPRRRSRSSATSSPAGSRTRSGGA